MKSKIILLFFIFSSCLYGQGNKFTVSGVVTDCKTKLSIIDFPVKIVCSDGNVVEAKTDVNGKYIIELHFAKLPLSCVVVFYTADNPISCLYTGEKTKFTIEDSLITSKTEDICLVNMGEAEAIVFPDIFFKNNTTQFTSKNEKRKIEEIAKIMNDNPTFVIQIDGHGRPSEAIDRKIGLIRAQKVYEFLLKKGIDKNRMVIVDFTNNEAFTNVSFRILRKDYIPKQK